MGIVEFGIAAVTATVGMILAWLTYRRQYAPNVRIKKLALHNPEQFLFVYGLTRKRGGKPFVSAVAYWYRILISNNSAAPVSVVNFDYQEGDGIWQPVPVPFAVGFRIDHKKIRAKDFVELPLRLDVSESIELGVFIPMSVTEELGSHLIHLFRNPAKVPKMDHEIMLFDETYLENMQDRVMKDMKASAISKVINVGMVDIPQISLNRTPGHHDESGNWFLRDQDNQYDDGFRYKYKADVASEVGEILFSNIELHSKNFKSPSAMVELRIELSTGKTQNLVLKRQSSALDPLA